MAARRGRHPGLNCSQLEEKPPEGCNKDPKPVIPKPGAAQLWLVGLMTKEEGENNKNTSIKMK